MVEKRLPYDLVIEAADAPDFFGFFSPELQGFTGIGRSIEDCPEQARRGMREHVGRLSERGLPVPPRNLRPMIVLPPGKPARD